MLNRNVRVGSRVIGEGHPVFIIAEAGVNHLGNVEIAKHLVDMAVISRADAVKFQIFRTENLVSSIAPDWIERLKPKELPYEAFVTIKEYCDKRKIMFMATAHDDESLGFLEELGPPAYKIGSGEVNNTEYVRRVAGFGKPVILSTGMYSMDNVRETVRIFEEADNKDLVLLHCVTCYPPAPEDINLKAIETMKQEFGCPVGFSDHSIGIDIVLAATALGASVIEKHIAVSKSTPGSQDCLVSCDGNDLPEMVNSIRRIEKALGTGRKSPAQKELLSRDWARKSVVARVEIKKGEVITAEMLTLKRPGTGISPEQINELIGRKARTDLAADSLVPPYFLD